MVTTIKQENIMSIVNTTLANAGRYVSERIDFNANGTFYGMNVGSQYAELCSPGWLAGGWRDRLRRERPSYIVYSYNTPIAWWSEGHGWSKPDTFHSVTTSHHQGKCPVHQSIN